MNEAFSDYRIFGDIKTNQPIMPFFDSIKENCVHGYALSSVFGGNTANSEFEFLTGHSMSFLPTGSVPYQQYIDENIFALPWYLRSLGYNTLATHPFRETGWSRNVVYPKLGFEQSTFLDDYPKQDFVRTYVSDREMLSYILDELKETKNAPLFCFGITMQNHGGYTYEGDDFQKTISLEGYNKEYPEVEQYLTLIQKSDEAIAEFVGELENVEEDTIVLFFGDHQPSLSQEWYLEISDGSFDTLSKQMQQYMIPFFIWANYDIPEETISITSLNYLAAHLLKAGGVELPSYFDVLTDIELAIPAINILGYYSSTEQRYVGFEDLRENDLIWLRKYEYLQYNNLFDKKNRSEYFYSQYIISDE